MARGSKPRKRTRNEKIMIVVGLLVAVSMVISSFVVLFTQ
jgi:predicted nucleic acid-binding Zn ribbon protein